MEASSPKIIVVGAGVSGMSAALSAISAGALVTIFSRAEPYRSSSARLRDGISAALDTAGEADSIDEHALDTLLCGDFLAHAGRVQGMCAAAPAILEWLARMGVCFDRTAEGMIRLSKSAGASKRRRAIAGRSTGAQILSALSSQILRAQANERAHLFAGWEFLSLITDEKGVCRGIVAENKRNMEIKGFAADAVVICTGGYPAIFSKNAAGIDNDGSAAMSCYAQGAAFANPEFSQLTPFAIQAGRNFIAVPESLILEGGHAWVEKDGRPWNVLEELYPKSRGIVPRDIAARAVLKAMKDASNPEQGPAKLFVDITQLDPDFAETMLGSFLESCDHLPDLDPMHSPVEVSPAVFATMGGLWVDANHATSVEGLYAAGNCACQYHGAGMLSGNELLASIYGGIEAAKGAVSYSHDSGLKAESVSSALLSTATGREVDAIAHIAAQEGNENAHLISRELGDLLFASTAMEKDNAELKKAAAKVEELALRFSRAPILDRAEWANSELSFMRGMRHRFELARMIIAASIVRDESRGSHFKPAFPKRDDSRWLAITKASWTETLPKISHPERLEFEKSWLKERKY